MYRTYVNYHAKDKKLDKWMYTGNEIQVLERSGDAPTCMYEIKNPAGVLSESTGKSESLEESLNWKLQTLGECENSDVGISKV